MHLDQAFFNQSLEAEIDRAKPHTQILGQRALTDLRCLMQTAQDFKLDFLLETSQFLKWGYEAQSDFGTLPPCRFTISKRGQRDLAGVRNNKVQQKVRPKVRRTNMIVPHRHDFEKGFLPNRQYEAGLSARFTQTGRCDTHGHGLAQDFDQHHDPALAVGHLVDAFDAGKRRLRQTHALARLEQALRLGLH
jgi:hypothetical protein